MAKRRRFEPGTPEYARLVTWFVPPALGGQGLSVRAALAAAHGLGWDMSRGTIDNYRREILGQASANPDVVARAVAEGHLPPGGIPVGPSAPLVEASVAPAPAAAAPPPAPEVELDADPLVNIERLLERQLKHGLSSMDPGAVEKTLRTVTNAQKVVRELRREREAAGGRAAGRVYIYLPEERPDPHLQDPNDPASWPVRAAA